jgi:SAM-dependent methyltransferase
MSDWTAGYVADVGYTCGYYPDLNPLRSRLPLLYAGWAVSPVQHACELGFGQGISLNLHAAASDVYWWGTDFNPSHAAFARSLAGSSATPVHISDEAFHDFCHRTDLPDFDFIGLHGIWSWISEANRAVIVDFLRRKLKAGGVACISYNTLPGWAGFAPLRYLLAKHAEVVGAAGGGSQARVSEALQFVDRFLQSDPQYIKANPQALQRLKHTVAQDSVYLAHEYLNDHWSPMYFADIHDILGAARLSFACSAQHHDHVSAANFTAAQQEVLRAITHMPLAETVRDFMVNRQFRRDYWIKGPLQLTPLDKLEAFRRQRVQLMHRRAGISLKMTLGVNELTLNPSVYNAVLDELANHEPCSFGELERRLAPRIPVADLAEALMVLMGSNLAVPVSEGEVAPPVRARCDAMNAQLAHMARSDARMVYACSPMTGGGITMGRIPLMYWHALKNGTPRTPAALAQHVWALLHLQGQALYKDGKLLETEHDNIAELKRQAAEFLSHELPIFNALQI